MTGMTILNNFTSVYGADAVAAMGIAYKIYMVPMQVSLGFSQGIMPLVSYTFASGNRRRMKDAILFALKIIVPSSDRRLCDLLHCGRRTHHPFYGQRQCHRVRHEISPRILPGVSPSSE